MVESPSDIVEAMRVSKTGVLGELEQDFYEQARKLIENLEETLSTLEANSREAIRLSDQLRTAKKSLSNLFRNRMLIVCKLAVKDATQGRMGDYSNMLEIERETYERVYEAIRKAKESSIELKKDVEDKGEEKEVVKKSKVVEGVSTNNIKYVVVRVLRDIPTFLGGDGLSYTLKAEDVATLPRSNAEVLMKKGIAMQIKLKG